MKIGIAGAGLLGRLAAWRLAHAGHEVEVFDPAEGPEPRFDGQGPAGFTAAGMLSPLAELDACDADTAQLGWHSIAAWAGIVRRLGRGPGKPPHFEAEGSLLVAHAQDQGAARRVLARITAAARDWPQQPLALAPERLRELEPALHVSGLQAWLLPGEASICTIRTLNALRAQAPGVCWHWRAPVLGLRPGRMQLQSGWRDFDWVCDLRGLGARPELALRGVRGEVIWLHAPGVALRRPVRLLHPRHRLYLVPRPGGQLLLGASEIESEDRSPVSVRSALELLSAAQGLLPGLAEARILRLDRNLRPALPDNRPQVDCEPGLLRINGLYRHGWLLAPALLDQALAGTALEAAA